MRDPRGRFPTFGDFPGPPICFICGRPTAGRAYLDEVVQQKLGLCGECRGLAERGGLMEPESVLSLERAAAAREAFRPKLRRRLGSKRRG